MTRYFEQVKELAPLDMTDRQISDDLNEFETKVFDRFPWALAWPEESQNELILMLYRRRFTRQ